MPILDLANNIIFKGFAKLKFKFNQTSCTTCLSNFVYDESSMKHSLVILECNHVFHLNCKITYIKHLLVENESNIKCPVCSHPIKKNLIIRILKIYNTKLLQLKDSLNNTDKDIKILKENDND